MFGKMPLRGHIAENADGTRHFLKDAQVFEPYLTLTSLPVLLRGEETDLSKATLVGGSAFADLIRHRDRHLVTYNPKETPKEIKVKLVRVVSTPGFPDEELILLFYLTPLYFGGVFWTYVITAEAEIHKILADVFPPLDPKDHNPHGPLQGLQT